LKTGALRLRAVREDEKGGAMLTRSGGRRAGVEKFCEAKFYAEPNPPRRAKFLFDFLTIK